MSSQDQSPKSLWEKMVDSRDAEIDQLKAKLAIATEALETLHQEFKSSAIYGDWSKITQDAIVRLK